MRLKLSCAICPGQKYSLLVMGFDMLSEISHPTIQQTVLYLRLCGHQHRSAVQLVNTDPNSGTNPACVDMYVYNVTYSDIYISLWMILIHKVVFIGSTSKPTFSMWKFFNRYQEKTKQNKQLCPSRIDESRVTTNIFTNMKTLSCFKRFCLRL